MNIFYLDTDPTKAAEYMVDKHVVKMILETAQLLSTTHRVLDGEEWIDRTENGRSIKRWRLKNNKFLDERLYKATHVNHPCAIWTRQNSGNYYWLHEHFIGLCDEYTHRYSKVHKCNDMIPWLERAPRNIITTFYTSPPSLAMPDEHKVSDDPVECYQHYYKYGKSDMHKWTRRQAPDWI